MRDLCVTSITNPSPFRDKGLERFLPDQSNRATWSIRSAQATLYLWDWSSVEGEGPRFENMLASQLLKYCHWLEDTQGHAMELRYLRDTDKREIDFVVLKNKRPIFAVECKSGERAIGPALHYFAERTPIPRFYQTHLGERHYETGKVTVLPFIKLCQELKLP